MYSCDTCCMIRDMMEMNDLDCAKCQVVKVRDIMGIIENVKCIRQRKWCSSSQNEEQIGNGLDF